MVPPAGFEPATHGLGSCTFRRVWAAKPLLSLTAVPSLGRIRSAVDDEEVAHLFGWRIVRTRCDMRVYCLSRDVADATCLTIVAVPSSNTGSRRPLETPEMLLAQMKALG